MSVRYKDKCNLSEIIWNEKFYGLVFQTYWQPEKELQYFSFEFQKLKNTDCLYCIEQNAATGGR